MPGLLLFEPFALWHAARVDPALRQRPAVTVWRRRVTALTPEAKRAGVRIGMPLAAAGLLCPELAVAPTSAAEQAGAWEALLAELHGYTPRLEPLAPGRVWLQLSAAEAAELAADYGARAGVAAVREIALLAALAAFGGRARVVPDGAEEAFLDRLPLRFLGGVGVSAEALERCAWLGLTHVGQLRRWREEQRRAFLGPDAALLRPLLIGPWRREVARYTPPPTVGARLAFDEPVFEPWQLTPALRRLAEQLVRRLDGRHAGRLQLSASLPGLQLRAARIAKEPLHEPAAITRLAWLALMESGALPLGIEELTVELSALLRPAEQAGLWPPRPTPEVRRQAAVAALERRFPGVVMTAREDDPWALAAERRMVWVAARSAAQSAAPSAARAAGALSEAAAGDLRSGGDGLEQLDLDDLQTQEDLQALDDHEGEGVRIDRDGFPSLC